MSTMHSLKRPVPRANTPVSAVFTKDSPRGTVCVPMLIEILKTSIARCASVFRSRNARSRVSETAKCSPANLRTSLGQ